MKAIWSKDGNLYDARVMKKHDNGKFFNIYIYTQQQKKRENMLLLKLIKINKINKIC